MEAFATATILGVFLVFARLGAALIFMPGFGEAQIPVRERLLIAVVLAVALYPAMGIGAVDEGRPLALALLFGGEVTVGLWIGLVARTLLSALQFAGYQIALMSGLANALAPNTGSFQGATTLAAALLMGAVALIFVTDTHHLIIGALVMSYTVFTPGALPVTDMSDQFARAAQTSLYMGLSIAAPFYVAGLVLNIGMGLANRMMATLPVFFVAQPLLIASALGLMVLAIPTMMMGFLGPFSDWLITFGF